MANNNITFPVNNAPENETEICLSIVPSMTNSHGILEHPKSPGNFLSYSLPLLELQMVFIIFTTQGLYFLLSRFGITMFVCQVLTGIILGPTFLGRYDFIRQIVFPIDSQDTIFTAGLFGFGIYLFLCAVKIDTGMILRSGKQVIIIGVVSLLVPLVLGLVMLTTYTKHVEDKHTWNEGTIVVIINSFSTFSIIIHVLEELKLVNSELGLLAISSSLVADTIGMSMGFLITFLKQNLSIKTIVIDMSAFVAFASAAMLIIRPMILWVIRKTPQGSPFSSFFIYTIIIMVFVSEVYFHVFHQLHCLGAIAIGSAIPAGPTLGSALIEKLESFTFGVFLPLIVSTSVMKADLSVIFHELSKTKLALGIIVLSFGAKLVACLIPSLYWKMPLIDSLIFALIMTCKGIIELILSRLAADFMLINEEVFAILVFCLLINSTFVAITVKCLYDPSRKYAGYQARNIMSLKPNSELQILACVHKPENVTSIIKLFDVFHPHRDRRIGIHVLHLIELIGRAKPVLISHQKQKPVSHSPSHNVIFSFSHYEQNNLDAASVISIFTAISPTKLMNEDICIRALANSISLILLPLHRRWSIHGTVEAEDNNLRTVNCKVLEKAPCSVGIFFDRGKLGRRSCSSVGSPPRSLSIAMIFLGGNDDCEALLLAKRMVKDSAARLTVIHFIPEVGKMINSVSKKLDSVVLEDIIYKSIGSTQGLSNVEYKEQVVKDGPQTALAIRSVADEYDLFLVGRRYGIESPQTAGLSQWTEFPELGIIGDLLACKDFTTRAAVLVVQQQKQMK